MDEAPKCGRTANRGMSAKPWTGSDWKGGKLKSREVDRDNAARASST